jgi:hypothetical protein
MRACACRSRERSTWCAVQQSVPHTSAVHTTGTTADASFAAGSVAGSVAGGECVVRSAHAVGARGVTKTLPADVWELVAAQSRVSLGTFRLLVRGFDPRPTAALRVQRWWHACTRKERMTSMPPIGTTVHLVSRTSRRRATGTVWARCRALPERRVPSSIAVRLPTAGVRIHLVYLYGRRDAGYLWWPDDCGSYGSHSPSSPAPSSHTM